MGVNFKLIFILTGLIFILSSCRTSAPVWIPGTGTRLHPAGRGHQYGR